MQRAILLSLVSIGLLQRPVISAEAGPETPTETIEVSISSFNDIVVDAAKMIQKMALKGKRGSGLTDDELADLPLKLPTSVLRLWMEAVPILEANAKPGFKAPQIFPPGLAEAIAKVPESEISAKHVVGIVRQLNTIAAEIAQDHGKDTDKLRPLKFPRKWVDEFLVERQRIAMVAMQESEMNGGKVAVQNRGENGLFAEVGDMKFYRRISTGDVPEIGPIYCAPFGKGGTWNLYQVINKPVTWLQAQSDAEGAPLPLGIVKPGVTGHLVSLHSAEENAFVVRIAKDISYFWIGLNDRRLEAGTDPNGPWEWSSGEPVTFRNWVGKEPDGGWVMDPGEIFDSRTDEDGVVCAGTLEPNLTGRWKDFPTGTYYPRNQRASYVIEWNLNAPEPVIGARQIERSDAVK